MSVSTAAPARLHSLARLLTARRLRVHAIILAICMWGVCAVDFLTPGVFDREGNIKFQDFLSFYISGKLIAQGRSVDLYNEPLRYAEMLGVAQDREAGHSARNVSIPNLYGPQVALLFVPFAHLPFLVAAQVWDALNLLIYAVCIYVLWRRCARLRTHRNILALAAVAFPPLFHFFVRGQLSVLVLACFAAAFLALDANRPWLAGLAFGCLAFKSPFLLAIPLIFLLAQAWKVLAALVASAATQLFFARIYFGHDTMQAYVEMLRRAPRWINRAELPLASVQMHSLRSFWTLIIPSADIALALYIVSSIAVVAVAAAIWKSTSPLGFRFSALTLAALLVNPHLFIYDLLALVPALLLLTNWMLENEDDTTALRPLLYAAFVVPLFGPLSRWTHLQLSVLVFAAVLWLLYRVRNQRNAEGVEVFAKASA